MNTRRKSKLRLIVIGSAAAVVALASTGAVKYTAQPNFCGSCHEMKSLHAGWSTGAHAKTDCYDCHVDHTIQGHVTAKANGLRQVFVHFTEKVDMDKVSAQVPDQRCVRCHDMTNEVKFGKRVVTAHRKHTEAKLQCVSCHINSGHSRETFVGFKSESCIECHSRKPQEIPDPYLKRPPCTRTPVQEQMLY